MIFQTYPRQKYIIDTFLNKRKKKNIQERSGRGTKSGVCVRVRAFVCACGVL